MYSTYIFDMGGHELFTDLYFYPSLQKVHTESVKAWVGMSWVRTVGSLNRLGASKIFSDDNKFAVLLAFSMDMGSKCKSILMKFGNK